MTTASLIGRIRRLVQDETAPYHWSDARIKDDLGSAILALHSLRPETRYVDGALVDRVELPAADSTKIGIDDRFADALAYFAAHLAYADDCTDPVSKALSDDFLGKFRVFAQA